VAGEDEEGAPADGVGGGAVDGGLALGEVGDAAAVLDVLGVAEEDDALDLVLEGGVELGDGAGNDGGTLAVTTGGDGGVGALGVGQVDETLGLLDGLAVGAAGKEVGSQVSGVGATNTLDPDAVAVEDGVVLVLEAVGDVGTSGRTLLRE